MNADFEEFCRDHGYRPDDPKAKQEHGIHIAINTPEVQKMVSEGWKLERHDLPNGDVELALSR